MKRSFEAEKQEWTRRAAETRAFHRKYGKTEDIFTARPLVGKALLAHLINLHRETQDHRFSAAVQALQAYGYDGKVLAVPKHGLSEFVKDAISRRVSTFIREGHSARISCAILANEIDLEAHSFEAAVKHIERIWRQRSGPSH
jgi:hypothetical protein